MKRLSWLVAPLLLGGVVLPAKAAPIRTTNPSTGLFAGRIIAPRFSLTAASGNGVDFQERLYSLDLTTRPSPRTAAGVLIPYLQRELRTSGRTYQEEGLGDVVLFGKYRFHRKLYTWGLTGDVSYQTARKRFVFGANAAYTANLEARGFRPGNEVRVNLDTEYLLLPLKYQEPGKEVFVLVEWLFVHRDPSRFLGADLPSTGGTQLFIAPGIQYAASERLLLEASLALPVYQNLRGQAPGADFNLLVGFRYVY